MPLTISDKTLREAGLSERDVLVDFACWLFDTGRLALWPAAKIAGMSRIEFEDELMRRGLPVYRVDIDDIEADLAAIKKLGDQA